MLDSLSSVVARKLWVRAALLLSVTLVTGEVSAMERPRIAVAVERAGELGLPREFGEGAAGRALAQGVREACLEPVTLQPRTKYVDCATLADVPGAQVCVDETVERALTLEIRCDGAGASAEAIDLSRSGCEAGDCFAVEAKRAGATDLLVVHGAWKDGLSLVGVVTDLATGRTRTVSAQDLEKTYNPDWPRSGSQVLALLKWFSRRLSLDVLGDHARAGGAGVTGETPALVTTTPTHPPASSSGSRRWVGWTLLGGGALAGAAAAVLWSKNNDLASCAAVASDPDPCREVRRTLVPAIVLGAGAAAAIVAGTVVLVRGRRGEATLAVSALPSAVVLGGRF